MTMHMIQGVNTTRNKKRQPKMTKTNWAKWKSELPAYNRKQRQMGMPAVSIDEYVKILHGQTPKRTTHTHETFTEYKPTYSAPRRGSSTEHIKSLQTTESHTSAPERKEYTGTLVKGIGTMHKSNAVPVIDEQAMKDLASMRR